MGRLLQPQPRARSPFVSIGPRTVYAHEKELCGPGGTAHQPAAPQSLLGLATKQVTEPQSTALI